MITSDQEAEFREILASELVLVGGSETANRILKGQNYGVAANVALAAMSRVAAGRDMVLDEAIEIAAEENKTHNTGTGFDSQPAHAASWRIMRKLQALKSLPASPSPKRNHWGEVVCEHGLGMPTGCNGCQRKIGDYDNDGNPASPSPAAAPGHTDLMVTPESLDDFMEINPLPIAPAPGGEHCECPIPSRDECRQLSGCYFTEQRLASLKRLEKAAREWRRSAWSKDSCVELCAAVDALAALDTKGE